MPPLVNHTIYTPPHSWLVITYFSQLTAADFEELNPPAVLVFASDRLVSCADISIVADTLIELTEFFIVNLGSNDTQVIIDTNQDSAQVFIADDDGEVNLHIA